MPKDPKLGQAQKGLIAALLCMALVIGVFDGLSSQHPTAQPNSAAKTDNPANQQKEKDGWPDPLVIVTFLLVIVGTAQLGLFYRQLTLIRESLVDAKKAADAAEGAASAAGKQAKIAEATLTQLERPYIFIFDVREFGFDPETAEYFVEYSVANYGKMPAIIEGAYIGFVFSDRAAPPAPPLMEDSHTLMTAPILQAGERRDKIREYLPTGSTTGAVFVDVRFQRPSERTRAVGPVFDVPEGNDYFFRAIIEYRGPSSQGHSTGALWLTNYPASGQLAQRGGDEYNYVK
jgi:hypothetical protein